MIKRCSPTGEINMMRVDDGFGEHDGEQRERAEHRQADVHDVRPVAVESLFAVPFTLEHENGQERRGKQTAGDEFEDDVGQVVRNLVGGGEQGVAQRKGHGPRADEPRHA